MNSNIQVVDDCASDKEVILEVTYIPETACPGEFQVQPTSQRPASDGDCFQVGVV